MDANEVKVIRWPKEKEKRALYRDLRVFRLLVVDPASPAPICTDSREDWIRAPIVRDDFNARLTSLRVKANNFRPHIDENQVLHFENRAVPLSEPLSSSGCADQERVDGGDMRPMRLVEHRALRSRRQVFNCAKARSPGARSRAWSRLYCW